MIPMIFRRKKTAQLLRQNSKDAARKRQEPENQRHTALNDTEYDDNRGQMSLGQPCPEYGNTTYQDLDRREVLDQRGKTLCISPFGPERSDQQRRSPSPVGSGEWAVKECEAHTTWLNNIRRQRGQPVIEDLRLAVADGITVVQLVEAITNSEVHGVEKEADISRPQALVNLDRCLAHLASQNVDVIGIQAGDLSKGDLKSSLLLFGRIRKFYDSTYGRQTLSDKGLACGPRESSPTHFYLEPVMPGRVETSPSLPRPLPQQRKDKATPQMRRGLAVDDDSLVPGMLGGESLDSSIRTRLATAQSGAMTTAERITPGLEKRSEERHHYDSYSLSRSPYPSNHVTAHRMQSPPERPPSTLGVAWAASSTSKPRQHNDHSSTPQGSNADSMMTSRQHVTKYEKYDIGELLLPPPPSCDVGDGMSLVGGFRQMDVSRGSGEGGQSEHTFLAKDRVTPELGYVPSQPSERKVRGEVSSAQNDVTSHPVLFARPPTVPIKGPVPNYTRPPSGPAGGSMENYTRPPTGPPNGPINNYARPPACAFENHAFVSDSKNPVKGDNQRGNNENPGDLRSAWNKLYGSVPSQRTTPTMPRRDVIFATSNISSDKGRRMSGHDQLLNKAPPLANLSNTAGTLRRNSQPDTPPVSALRESPNGESSSTQGQATDSASSQRSSYSGQVTFSTFKPESKDDKDKTDEDDKELVTIGPSSKYPEPSGSRPPSARLTPQTLQADTPKADTSKIHTPKADISKADTPKADTVKVDRFSLRDVRLSSSQPNGINRKDMTASTLPSPRTQHVQSSKTASSKSVFANNTSLPNEGYSSMTLSKDGLTNNMSLSRDGLSRLSTITSSGGSEGNSVFSAGNKSKVGNFTLRASFGAKENLAFVGDSEGSFGSRAPNPNTQAPVDVDFADSIFDFEQKLHLQGSESSSNRSVTPPLPPLSPSSSQPGSELSASTAGHNRFWPMNPKDGRTFAPSYMNSLRPLQNRKKYLTTEKTPDLLVTSSSLGSEGEPGGGLTHVANQGPTSQMSVGGTLLMPIHRAHRVPSTEEDSHDGSRGVKYGRSRSLEDVRESENESNDLSFDVENTMLTVEPSDMSEIERSVTHVSSNHQQTKHTRAIKGQLERLESMYHDVIKLVGTGKPESGRRWSIASSDTSSLRRGRHVRSSSTHRPYSKDLRGIQRRFQRLESHLVTLARSVAHLSSEMRSNNSLRRDLELVKRELKELKQKGHGGADDIPNVSSFEKFRGWIPSLTNPKRINKLTQFFGQEPPLLEIFLKKLGYERYTKNFQTEHIGMLELPYLTEDRLESIGIPMGPRLRILQESQLCFRQENFDIYIV